MSQNEDSKISLEFIGTVILFYLLISVVWGAWEYLIEGKLQPNFFDSMIASLLALFITKSISLEKRLKRLLKLSKKQNTVIKEQTDIIKMLSNRMGESPPSDYIN